MTRLGKWLDQFDWGAMAALFLAFYLCVVGPVIINAPALMSHQQEHGAQQEHAQKQGDVPPAQGGDDAIATYTYWLVVFTAILAISTIGLWIVTAKTLSHAQEDAARQASDMKESIAAANISAGAAVDALDSARTSSERQLRAYVGVERLNFRITSQVKGYEPVDPMRGGVTYPDYLVVTVKNYGQTPARSVATRTVVVQGPFLFRLPVGFDYNSHIEQPSTLRNVVTEGFLSKDQTEEVTIPIPDANIVWDAKLKSASLIVFGRIYYRDIFNNNWSTQFCQIWEPWFPLGERFVTSDAFNSEDQRQPPA